MELINIAITHLAIIEDYASINELIMLRRHMYMDDDITYRHRMTLFVSEVKIRRMFQVIEWSPLQNITKINWPVGLTVLHIDEANMIRANLPICDMQLSNRRYFSRSHWSESHGEIVETHKDIRFIFNQLGTIVYIMVYNVTYVDNDDDEVDFTSDSDDVSEELSLVD